MIKNNENCINQLMEDKKNRQFIELYLNFNFKYNIYK